MIRLLLSLLLVFTQSGGTPLGSTSGGAGGGGGSKAFVQSCLHSLDFATESTITCVFTSNVTANNAVVCGVWWASTTVTLSSVKGSTDTYTLNSTSGQGNGATMESAVQFTSVGGYKTITATFSSSTSDNHAMICHEVSGSASAVDVKATNAQASPGHGTDGLTSGSVTTTVNGDYIFGMTGDSNFQADAISAGTGYTKRVDDTTNSSMASEDQVQSSSGSIAATFTDTGTGFPSTLTMVMALK